ncbi:hypothetical protein K466DRAFT_452471, partial [Polyporus arcularius HHB13444]
GKITISNLNSWEHHCNLFFRERGIDDDKKVQKATFGFTNELLQDWYLANQDDYDTMSWKAFVVAIRSRFLPRGWASAIRSEIISTRMTDAHKFEDFVLSIEKLNARLRGTDARFSEAALRDIVTANAVEELAHLCSESPVVDIKDYADWKASLVSADLRRRRVLDLVSKQFATHKHTTYSGSSSTQATTSKSGGIPKLTDVDRKLLMDNEGCFKCRKFYAGHLANDCKVFPNSATYKPLTSKMAQDARAAYSKEKGRSATVGTVTDTDPNVMAAINVLNSPPAHASCVLGSGSDSEVCVSPFYAPHTLLSAIILSPSVESSALPLLIDSGAPSVLIREELAVRLQLPIRSLPEPYKLGNAWGVGENESTKYVKLRVALPDHSWSSITCRAIVVPSLCAPVILGKPFLESNQIIEDHSAPDDARRMEHLRFLRELRCTTAVRRIHADRHTVDASTCAATLVRDRVEQLAFQETLVREDTAMKAEFVDLFPEDIPHINHLPSDVYHRFVLKDPDMVIARRQYDCPKKYREAWK